MSSALEIDGRTLHPIREAAQVVSYSRDYVTRLAREKKVVAQYVGRQWFVDLESLKSYVETVALEQELRKKKLSEERKLERQAREAAEQQHTLHLKRARTLEVRSVVAAALVLGVGLLSGVAIYQTLPADTVATQVASTSDAPSAQLSASPVVAEKVSPVASSEREVVSVAEPTSEIDSLGEVSEGILLLPHGSATATPEELFSDDVEIVTLSSGAEAVVRVDESGQPVGNVLPFVRVPVNHSDI